jgi:hypothetical protein
MVTKNYPRVLTPQSGTCDQKMTFWFNPNLNFLTPSESTFIKVRKIIRILQVTPSLSIREISLLSGIEKKEIPELIGRMAAKDMIVGNGHSETKYGNEVQLRLSF